MTERNKHIDDIYRDGLSGYNEAPREGMWSRIEQNLDKLDAADHTVARKVRYGKGFWFGLSGLLLITTASIFTYKYTHLQQPIAAENKTTAPAVANTANPIVATNTTVTNNEVKEAENATASAPSSNSIGSEKVATEQAATNAITKETIASLPASNITPIAYQSGSAVQAALHMQPLPAIKESGISVQPIQAASMSPLAYQANSGTQVATKPLPAVKESGISVQPIQPVNSSLPAYKTNNTARVDTKPLPAIKESGADVQSIQAAHGIVPIAYANNSPQVQSTRAVPAIKENSASVAQIQPISKPINTNKQYSPLNTIATPVPAPVAKSLNQEPAATQKQAAMPANKEQEVGTLALASAGAIHTPASGAASQKTIAAGDPIIEKGKTSNTPAVSTTMAAKEAVKEDNTNIAAPQVNNAAADDNTTTILYASKTPVLNTTTNKKVPQSHVVVPNIAATQAQLNDNQLVLNDTKEQGKSEVTASANNAADPQPQTLAAKMHVPFDMGVKLSYEIGTGKYKGNKAIISGYGEYSLNKKLSLLFEPGLMITVLNKPIDYGTQSYYNNRVTQYDSLHPTGGIPDPVSFYRIYQQYDSIIAARKTGKNVTVGLDLPILVKYQFSNSFYALGGVTINFSKLFTIEESVSATYQTVTDTFVVGMAKRSEFQPIYRNYNPNHSSTQYAPVPQPDGNPLRLGYMVGLGYNVNDKMNFEFRMTQTITNQDYIPDANIKNIYTQPYFRLTIGFNLYKYTGK